MKSFKWMLAALLAVAVCTPLMAQNNKDLGAKIQRQIQRQQKKHHSEKCRWCGQEITEASGRCPADPDLVCLPAPKAEKAKPAAKTEPRETRCPKCGEEYDIDVLYHGMQHRCEAEANAQFTPEEQAAYRASMQTLGVNELYELDPVLVHRAEALLQKDRDDHNGYPEHSFEYYYQQLDAQRNAPVAEAAPVKCRRCGKVMHSMYSPCSADPNNTCTPAPETGSAVGVQPNTGKTVSTAKDDNYCPKCGEKYDIDVLYHGMQHRCEKAEKPVKYHPAEK